jgi:DNA-binding IclR family transcriptional regulator
MSEKQPITGPRGVSRVLRLLELLATDIKPLRLWEIQRDLDMPVSSCHVLLQEMIRLGYLQLTEDRRYEKSVQMVVLGSRIRSASDLHAASRDILERLHTESGETVHLATAGEREIIYVDGMEAASGIISRVPYGTSRPLHASSPGYVFLAYAVDPTGIDDLLGPAPYKAYTQHTVTDRDALREIVKEVRTRGYGIAIQAQNTGMFGLCAPIFRSSDKLGGTLSISAPLDRHPNGFDSLARMVTRAAAEVTRRLGGGDWREIVARYASRQP